MNIWRSATFLLLLVGWACSVAAAGADDKKMLKAQQDQIQKLQQAKQSLEQANMQGSAVKQDLERQLRNVKAELVKARGQGSQVEAMQSELQVVNTDKLAMTKRLDDVLRELNDVKAAAREESKRWVAEQLVWRTEAQAALQAAAGNKDSLTKANAELSAGRTALQQCENQNAGLYKLNTDLLARYEKAISSRGPLTTDVFTQFNRVKQENDITEYQDRLIDLKILAPKKP
jgi:predicted RNase H-like nuclease (RuvC/YqgF family)